MRHAGPISTTGWVLIGVISFMIGVLGYLVATS